MDALTSSSYPLSISMITGFDSTEYPYLIMKDDDDIILVNIKSYESYVLFTDQDFHQPRDGGDFKYYDWGLHIVHVYGTSREDLNILTLNADDTRQELVRYTFN